MIKKSLLFLLLMALFAPWAAMAQTVTIGTGSTTYTSSPIDNYYNYSFTEILYTAADIAEGSPTYNNIVSMGFESDNGANGFAYGITVYMKNVDDASFGSSFLAISNDDVVFTGTVTPSAGWVTFDLDNNFTYDNTKNLLVAVNKTSGYKAGSNYQYAGSSYLWKHTATTEKTVILAHQDGSTYNPTTTLPSMGSAGSYWAQTSRPNVQLTFAAPPAYPKPTNVRPGTVTDQMAEILWDAPQSTNTITGYAYQYGHDATNEWSTEATVTTTSANCGGLTAQTEYDFRVKALYEGDNESDYATTSFTTECGSITTLPWDEDFTGMTVNTMPDCWDNSASTSSTLSSNPYYIWGVYSYGSGASANTMLRMYNAMVKSGTALINTQPITLPVGTVYQLTFDYSHLASCDAFSVKISEDGGTTFVEKGSYSKESSASNNSTNPGTFIKAEPILLSSYSGKTIIVQFYANATYGSGAIFLDNVSIDVAPTCIKPTALGATEDQPNQSVLSWTDNNGTDPANGWTVYYKKISDASYSSKSAPTNPYTLTGLTPATNYQYYVVANCSALDESDPSEVFSFTTGCPDYKDVPFTENFDEITLSSAMTPTANTMPVCWDYINTCTNNSYKYYPTAYYYSSTDYSNSSPNSLRFYSYYSSDPKDQYAILPAVQNVSGLRIKLYARLHSTSYDGTFTIGVMTDPKDASTFTQVGDTLKPKGTSYEQFIVPFSSYAGTGTYIAIKMAAATSSYRGVFIDDITVEEIPSCLEPTGLAEVPETATDHSLTFNWTAGGTETTWKLQYKKATETEWTTYPNAVTSKPFELPGLEASSIYDVRVATWCTPSDPNGISSYSDPVTAKTECGAVTVNATYHYSDNFNDYTSGTSGSGAPSNYPNDELPLCWGFLNRSQANYTYPMVFLSSYSDYAVSGNCLFFKSSSNTPIYAILPEFTNNISDLMLTFTYRNEGTSAGNGTLYVSYMTDPTNASTFNTTDAVACEKTTSKKEMEVFFANAPAGSYIAFKYQGGSSNSMYLSIDDVKVEPAPSCRKPSDLVCSSKTAHSATLSWTNGEEGQDAWQIAYSTNSSFAPTADFTPNGTTEWLADMTTNPATIEGLSQSTTYYAYVRANCGGGDYSAWCNAKVTFTTPAGNVTPTGLAVDASSITSSQATASWDAVAGNTLHQSYDIYWALATVTAVPDEPAAPNLISGITATSQDITGLSAETEYKVWVRDYCGTDGYSNWSSAVTFTTAADCQTPDGLQESEVTENSAKITWNTYGKTEFILQYKAASETDWTAVTGYVNSPYTFNGVLTPNTAYAVRVHVPCDNDDVWSSELSFRTECGAMTITATEYINEEFEDYTATNYSTDGMVPYCWDNYSTGTSYPYPHIVNGTSYNYYHAGSSSLNFIGEANAVAYVALPEFTNDLNTLMVNFWMKTEGNPDPVTYKLSLGYITDGDINYNTYQVIEEYDNTTTVTERTTYLGLKNVPTTATRLVLRWNHPTTSWHACCIDDLVVKLGPTCFPVNNLTYDEVQANSVKLSWDLVDDNQGSWQVQWATDADFTAGVQTRNATTHTDVLVNELSPETHYYMHVRANCGDDGNGEWSNTVDFTTLEACPAPTNLSVTPTQYTANLTWDGNNDSYNIQYRTAAQPTTNQLLFQGFEDGNLGSWTTVIQSTNATNQAECGVFDVAAKTDNYGFRFASANRDDPSDTYDQYLISPLLSNTGKLEFAYKRSNNMNETFVVGYSKTTNDLSAFTWGSTQTASSSSWATFTDESMPEDAKYFAIHYTSEWAYYLYIDDITIYEMAGAGAWTPSTAINTTEKSYQLPSLDAGTKYDVRVQGVCSGTPGNWSTQTFETVPYRTFTTTGNWNVAANWTPSGVPGDNDDVAIAAAATIPANTTAKANNITMQTGGSLTLGNSGNNITSSGQLWHSNTGVTATVNLHVYGYSSDQDNYHLIASPFAGSLALDGTSIVDTVNKVAFDLYMFDQNENTQEWRNYEADPQPFTTLDNGVGYLYANNKSGWNNFALTGTLQPSNEDVTVTLTYVDDKPFSGWNLVGNPFACNAYLNDASDENIAFYRMNAIGDGFTAATGAVAPMEGIFVQATATGQSFKFSRTQNSTSRSQLNVKLGKGSNSLADNAIIRFDNGGTLEKFSFRDNTAKVYIPQDGKDYAVVNAEAQGELPVNFKAETNGNYTLSFTTEDVEFSYLHLIDNMTGNDVDLLATPNYSFEARTTDYAARFKLVFCKGNANDDDSFGFIDASGNLIVNGDGMVQVIDMMGRIIVERRAGACTISTENMAPGVYVLHLINGNNVKTQKIVVK